MLTSKERAKLSSLAQSLNPVIHVGKAGAGSHVAAALDKALLDHELVKVRFVACNDERQALAEELAAANGAELVHIVGHVAVFYRKNPDAVKAAR